MIEGLIVGFIDATNSSKPLFNSLSKELFEEVAYCGELYCNSYFINMTSENCHVINSNLIKSIEVDKIVERSKNLGFESISHSTQMFLYTLNDFFQTKNLKPFSYYPVEDGGASFEIRTGNIYYNIEIGNENEASFYKEQQNVIPEGWEYSYSELMARLQQEF